MFMMVSHDESTGSMINDHINDILSLRLFG